MKSKELFLLFNMIVFAFHTQRALSATPLPSPAPSIAPTAHLGAVRRNYDLKLANDKSGRSIAILGCHYLLTRPLEDTSLNIDAELRSRFFALSENPHANAAWTLQSVEQFIQGHVGTRTRLDQLCPMPTPLHRSANASPTKNAFPDVIRKETAEGVAPGVRIKPDPSQLDFIATHLTLHFEARASATKTACEQNPVLRTDFFDGAAAIQAEFCKGLRQAQLSEGMTRCFSLLACALGPSESKAPFVRKEIDPPQSFCGSLVGMGAAEFRAELASLYDCGTPAFQSFGYDAEVRPDRFRSFLKEVFGSTSSIVGEAIKKADWHCAKSRR